MRITPADAGKTTFGNSVSATGWDHPRGCGENPYSQIGQLAILGSPPRMRGKLLTESVFTFEPRITPADAGKTL